MTNINFEQAAAVLSKIANMRSFKEKPDSKTRTFQDDLNTVIEITYSRSGFDVVFNGRYAGTVLKDNKAYPDFAVAFSNDDSSTIDDLTQKRPIPLSYPRFLGFLRQAGGMSADVALSIVEGTHASSEVRFLRALLLESTGPLERDDPLIQTGLDTLVSESVITVKGRDAIMENWPTG